MGSWAAQPGVLPRLQTWAHEVANLRPRVGRLAPGGFYRKGDGKGDWLRAKRGACTLFLLEAALNPGLPRAAAEVSAGGRFLRIVDRAGWW